MLIYFTGDSFLKRFLEAFRMKEKQMEIFDQLSATFSPEVIQKWEMMVATWNSNHKAPNPYQEPGCGVYHVVWTCILVTDISYSNDGPRCSSAIDDRRDSSNSSRERS